MITWCVIYCHCCKFNGLLGDLLKAGQLGEDKKHVICDSKKVFRANERVMKYSRAEENSFEKSNITGIFVDGRKDNTLILMHDETTGTCRKRTIKESHVTVTEEPKGKKANPLYTRAQN